MGFGRGLKTCVLACDLNMGDWVLGADGAVRIGALITGLGGDPGLAAMEG